MSSVRRTASVLAFAGGSVLVGLSVAGFTSPVPLPSVSPAVPVPSPSVPATLENLLNPSSSGQPSGDGSPTSRQAPVSAPPNSGLGATGTAPLAQPPGGIPDGTAPAVRSSAVVDAVKHVQEGHAAAGLPATGGPFGGGGVPLPLVPAVPAALLLALLFFGLRMTSRPVTARRYRIRVDFTAPGAPAGAAALAVHRLLQSELPAETQIRVDGDSAFLIEAPILQRAILGACLPEAAARARRVGLCLDWNTEPAPRPTPGPAAQPRLALS